ncbi:MAG: glycosyl hydrolase [Clostridiales bacterium]|nr:MAG: glycosyl hydrolase [Clostridiales bacterium]
MPTGVERYTALLKDTYTAVKAKYPDVKVAGPVISSLMDYADKYLKSFLAQTDINNYYDVFSFHNYSYSNSGLDNIMSSISADLALIPEDKEIYVTEFGVHDTAYSDTENDQYQAAGLAKYYLSMASENFCDRYYIYQLSKREYAFGKPWNIIITTQNIRIRRALPFWQWRM